MKHAELPANKSCTKLEATFFVVESMTRSKSILSSVDFTFPYRRPNSVALAVNSTPIT